jgi:hypothetical protein
LNPSCWVRLFLHREETVFPRSLIALGDGNSKADGHKQKPGLLVSLPSSRPAFLESFVDLAQASAHIRLTQRFYPWGLTVK